jgi:hypothetical protein
MQELKPQNLLAMEFPLRYNQRIVSVESRITWIIDIYVKMFLAYFKEDTKVKKRFMVELGTWWLRTKNSEKDENAISSANFAKTKNVKPGTYESIV